MKRIREQAGGAGLIVAVIALIAAISGTAIAAKGNPGLSAKQKKEVKAIAKGVQGPPGTPGAVGPQGPQGAQGPQGGQGPIGKEGSAGKNGESVKLTPATITQCGGRGGGILEQAPTKVEVCTGVKGEEGDPWTAGGTLPKEALLTGTWGFSGHRETITTEVGGVEEDIAVGETQALIPISFPIPLKEGLPGSKVHFSEEANFSDFDEGGSETVGCEGNLEEPDAPKGGHLCVYGFVGGGAYQGIFTPGQAGFGVSEVGGFLWALLKEEGPVAWNGSWAVRGF